MTHVFRFKIHVVMLEYPYNPKSKWFGFFRNIIANIGYSLVALVLLVTRHHVGQVLHRVPFWSMMPERLIVIEIMRLKTGFLNG